MLHSGFESIALELMKHVWIGGQPWTERTLNRGIRARKRENAGTRLGQSRPMKTPLACYIEEPLVAEPYGPVIHILLRRIWILLAHITANLPVRTSVIIGLIALGRD